MSVDFGTQDIYDFCGRFCGCLLRINDIPADIVTDADTDADIMET